MAKDLGKLLSSFESGARPRTYVHEYAERIRRFRTFKTGARVRRTPTLVSRAGICVVVPVGAGSFLQAATAAAHRRFAVALILRWHGARVALCAAFR